MAEGKMVRLANGQDIILASWEMVLLNKKETIEAIKSLKARLNIGLKDAKDACDLARGYAVLCPTCGGCGLKFSGTNY